ncbi:hypothetical protein [Deinococcus planocerae]|uniref:hypothetical protein n=1 Tax=Deinococcus planocerae TaxID=1737569 RepID=UPI001FE5DFCA|nr:hypothetical protein [Deinococcus planocerae]
MIAVTVRFATPADFPVLRPMLLDLGFVEDGEGRLLGYAAVHDLGPHLRSGNSGRTAKLDDL